MVPDDSGHRDVLPLYACGTLFGMAIGMVSGSQLPIHVSLMAALGFVLVGVFVVSMILRRR